MDAYEAGYAAGMQKAALLYSAKRQAAMKPIKNLTDFITQVLQGAMAKGELADRAKERLSPMARIRKRFSRGAGGGSIPHRFDIARGVRPKGPTPEKF